MRWRAAKGSAWARAAVNSRKLRNDMPWPLVSRSAVGLSRFDWSVSSPACWGHTAISTLSSSRRLRAPSSSRSWWMKMSLSALRASGVGKRPEFRLGCSSRFSLTHSNVSLWNVEGTRTPPFSESLSRPPGPFPPRPPPPCFQRRTAAAPEPDTVPVPGLADAVTPLIPTMPPRPPTPPAAFGVEASPTPTPDWRRRCGADCGRLRDPARSVAPAFDDPFLGDLAARSPNVAAAAASTPDAFDVPFLGEPAPVAAKSNPSKPLFGDTFFGEPTGEE
mmetsp:Transcript_1046/g.2227  ORF Transcript_1046/g.2227 Transcript_1046/m.2227 type:complete len:276 (+) Transcript_1046:114-941(+)